MADVTRRKLWFNLRMEVLPFLGVVIRGSRRDLAEEIGWHLAEFKPQLGAIVAQVGSAWEHAIEPGASLERIARTVDTLTRGPSVQPACST